MSEIEMRFGRRLTIRAGGRFAVAMAVAGIVAAVFIAVDRFERPDPAQIVWRVVPPG